MSPGDVTNDAMYTRLYKCSHNLMIPMHRKFNNDIFARFLAIMKNVVISFIKESEGPTFRPPCDVIGDVIIMNNAFYGILWDDLFISEAKFKLFLIFEIFSKWSPFWARDNLFYRKWNRKLNMPER